jgi:hypothetical protein
MAGFEVTLYGRICGDHRGLEQRSIMLPASVLDTLKDLPAGALKVLIYLCSCNQGQPFAASIPTITDATGIQQRSVIAALNCVFRAMPISVPR